MVPTARIAALVRLGAVALATGASWLPTARADEPVVLVTDPEALAPIEQAVGDFGMLLLGQPGGASNEVLARRPDYRSLIEPIVRDVRAIGARDPEAGVGIRGHAHRLFDVRWLEAANARFRLVAVAARLDRLRFAPDACGELRLVYRLAYTGAGPATQASRLPMTLAIELGARRADDADCGETARRWLAPPGLRGRALGDWAIANDGPLAPAQLSRARLVQVAVNVQIARWPSAVKPDLGGHADYLLRAFSWDAAGARFRERPLENTPDVERLRRSASLRQALATWLRDPAQRAAIDEGTVRLPVSFLALSAISVTPRGLARRANRPFRRLFAPSTFATRALEHGRFVRSPEAFVRRLDDLTCSGCHQSRSLAGFHVLGDDPADTGIGNALVTGSSPHVLADQTRRAAFVAALARGGAPDPARPFAERADVGDDRYGAHCGLGDPGFAAWTCADGLSCDAYEAPHGERTVGACLPATPRIGDPCEPARVRARDDAHREGVVRGAQRACEGVCERTRVGFPGGMCASSCDALGPDAACGSIAVLTPFNLCLAAGRPFSDCATEHTRPAGLRACSAASPCRDDYLCTRDARGQGTCIPPYFLLQLRVDGHPAP